MMSTHNNSTDHPLDLPSQTFEAIDKARSATQRARQTVELSFAPASAGAALSVVGLGAFILLTKAALPEAVKEPLAWSALVFSWVGTLLIWWFLFSWLREGRRGGAQSPLGDAITLSRRRRFSQVAIGLAVMVVSGIGFQALRGYMPLDIYFGTGVWVMRLAVLAAIAFYVRRFARSGFWEHLVFAAGIAGSWGLVTIVLPHAVATTSPAFASIGVVSLLITVVAAASLLRRWRHWSRANQAAAALDEVTGAEVA